MRMNRQQVRAELRAFDKEIGRYKSGRMSVNERRVMDARILRLQAAGIIKKKKTFLQKIKSFFTGLFLLALLVGCSHGSVVEIPLDQDCVTDQVELYGDLCAEESSGYEYMSGKDAHFQGVVCAVDSIQICLGAK